MLVMPRVLAMRTLLAMTCVLVMTGMLAMIGTGGSSRMRGWIVMAVGGVVHFRALLNYGRNSVCVVTARSIGSDGSFVAILQ